MPLLFPSDLGPGKGSRLEPPGAGDAAPAVPGPVELSAREAELIREAARSARMNCELLTQLFEHVESGYPARVEEAVRQVFGNRVQWNLMLLHEERWRGAQHLTDGVGLPTDPVPIPTGLATGVRNPSARGSALEAAIAAPAELLMFLLAAHRGRGVPVDEVLFANGDTLQTEDEALPTKGGWRCHPREALSELVDGKLVCDLFSEADGDGFYRRLTEAISSEERDAQAAARRDVVMARLGHDAPTGGSAESNTAHPRGGFGPTAGEVIRPDGPDGTGTFWYDNKPFAMPPGKPRKLIELIWKSPGRRVNVRDLHELGPDERVWDDEPTPDALASAVSACNTKVFEKLLRVPPKPRYRMTKPRACDYVEILEEGQGGPAE